MKVRATAYGRLWLINSKGQGAWLEVLKCTITVNKTPGGLLMAQLKSYSSGNDALYIRERLMRHIFPSTITYPCTESMTS